MSEEYKDVILSDGSIAKIDAEDYEWIMAYGNWEFYKRGRYAYTRLHIGGTGAGAYKHIAMHRVIAINHKIIPDDPNVIVDHINRDRLDNRKANLRPASKSQNAANRQMFRPGSTSRHKGVGKVKRGKKEYWRAYIRVDKKMKHLGYFNTERQAAIAYNKAAKEAFGEYAVLNDV